MGTSVKFTTVTAVADGLVSGKCEVIAATLGITVKSVNADKYQGARYWRTTVQF